MATAISEDALKFLHDDFVKLSRKAREAPCHFYSAESNELVPEEAWKFIRWRHEILSYNSPGGNKPTVKDIEEFEAFRCRILASSVRPAVALEMLPGAGECVCWSSKLNDEYLRHFDRLSESVIKLLAPQYPGDDSTKECKPRLRWIAMARRIVRSDDWYEPIETVVLDTVSDEELTKASKEFNDYPSRRLKGWEPFGKDGVMPLGIDDHLGTLICYLRFETVAALRTLGKSVPRILLDDLGNPASYSVKAIDLVLAARRRSAMECPASTSADAPASPDEKDRLATLDILLDELMANGTITSLFVKGADKWLDLPKDKTLSQKEIALLAGLSVTIASDTAFKDDIQKLKLTGVCVKGRGPYMLTDLGRDLLKFYLDSRSEKPDQSRGQSRG